MPRKLRNLLNLLKAAADPTRLRLLALLAPGELTVGDQFKTGDDQFAPTVTVVSIDGDEVLLDANHPLAGVDLTFDVEVLSTREATSEELRHGHAHGADGACGH